MELTLPNQRARLEWLLDSFADSTHQQRWVKRWPTREADESFSDAVNDLLEAVEGADDRIDAWALIGVSLYSNEEAARLQRVAELVDAETAQLRRNWRGWSGGRALKRLLRQEPWDEIRREAAEARDLIRQRPTPESVA